MVSAFLGQGGNFSAHGRMEVTCTRRSPAGQKVLRVDWAESHLPAVRPSAAPGASEPGCSPAQPLAPASPRLFEQPWPPVTGAAAWNGLRMSSRRGAARAHQNPAAPCRAEPPARLQQGDAVCPDWTQDGGREAAGGDGEALGSQCPARRGAQERLKHRVGARPQGKAPERSSSVGGGWHVTGCAGLPGGR